VSGFVTLFDRGGSGIARKNFDSMLDTIEHRGPDGGGTWFDNEIALGHQQLQSTPEARFDDQPYRDEDLVFVGDIRLDNRDELFRRVSISGEKRQIPDSRLLLSCYRKWGSRCLDELVGVFAFVIWDCDRKVLFCARDHMGIKPFYYHMNEDIFIAASEKKSLLAHPSVDGKVDELKIGEYLINKYADMERSFFESISRLSPAHAMTLSREKVDSWQYWELDPSRTITLKNDAAYERRFRELFEKAVQSRLRAAGPIGTDLSGGIDSSSITAVSRQLLPEGNDLHTFSNVYDNASSTDEREYIEAVLDTGTYNSHYIYDHAPKLILDEEELDEYHDHPIQNEMYFAGWKRMRRADREGMNVILGGEQGDVTLGYGFELLSDLLLTGQWRYLYHEIQSLSDVLKVDPLKTFTHRVLPNVIPDPVLRARRSIMGQTESVYSLNSAIDPQFVTRIGLNSHYLNMRSDSIFPRNARHLHCDALSDPHLVETYEERDLLAASYGIEKRYPFVDKRLVEFCLAIPRSQQLQNGWPRSIIRRSLQDILPQKIQTRWDKAGGNEAFQHALQNERTRLEEIIDNSDTLASYLRLEDLRTALDRSTQNPTARDERTLWRALSLSLWIENFN
jgi:asparagine synthase (glutamine-hydrolysing)